MTKHQITTVMKGIIPTFIMQILEAIAILEASGGGGGNQTVFKVFSKVQSI